MIFLLAFPIVAMVALAHRSLLLFAPSNVLIRRVRASRPTLSTVVAMVAIAAGLLVAVKVVSDAVAAGASGWLNLVVLVLAWDSFKVGWLAVGVALRIGLGAARRSMNSVLHTS
ncbi:hypothetical protein FHP29_18090 [Nocardioides albidus]|uniref:Uncharacterized protein n=1 Tax=Nocardioides albidus TaxID=1517589 RepID=A0A5C4VP88_9ACTN|nr:hypothetical protein [Nocardioides albidus]TNM37693.1 hypothetical protein FHP29_18090 [Nocardioides albidus]